MYIDIFIYVTQYIHKCVEIKHVKLYMCIDITICIDMWYIVLYPIFLTSHFYEHITKSLILQGNMILLVTQHCEQECSIMHFVPHIVECLYCFQLFL